MMVTTMKAAVMICNVENTPDDDQRKYILIMTTLLIIMIHTLFYKDPYFSHSLNTLNVFDFEYKIIYTLFLNFSDFEL